MRQLGVDPQRSLLMAMPQDLPEGALAVLGSGEGGWLVGWFGRVGLVGWCFGRKGLVSEHSFASWKWVKAVKPCNDEVKEKKVRGKRGSSALTKM